MQDFNTNLEDRFKQLNTSQHKLTDSNIQKNEVQPDFIFLNKKEFLLNLVFLRIADLKKISRAVLKIEEKEKQKLKEKIINIRETIPDRKEQEDVVEMIDFNKQRQTDLKNTYPRLVKYFFKEENEE